MRLEAKLKILFFTILAIQFATVISGGSVTFADALRGLEAMNQFRDGGQFNWLNYPNTDGAYSFFLSWWTPGQWVIPYLFQGIGITNLQVIQSCLIISMTSIGLWGYYRLFTHAGFSQTIVWLSMLTIVTNQLFYWHFLMYYGGDLLVFVLFPFLIDFTLRIIGRLTLVNVLCFILFGLIGFFFKSSWLLLFFATLVFLWFTAASTIFTINTRRIILLLVGVFVFSAVYYSFIQFGETPGSSERIDVYGGMFHDHMGDWFTAFGTPVGIFSRFTMFIQKLSVNISFNLNGLLLIPLLLSIVLYVSMLKQKRDVYQKLVLIVSLTYFGLMTVLYVLNRAISYEMRHFAIVGFLFIPIIIHRISKSNWKKSGLILCVLISIGDLSLFAVQTYRMEQKHQFIEGYKVPKEEYDLLKCIIEWDNATSDALVVSQEYWRPIHFIRKNDKISVMNLTEKGWEINSGMELTSKKFVDIQALSKSYVKILLIEMVDSDQISNQFSDYESEELFGNEIWRVTVFW